jgi:hypothetical protein
MHCNVVARGPRVLVALLLPLLCAVGGAQAGAAPEPPPDKVSSPTLTQALGPLVDKVIAQMKSDGRIPAGATAEDVAARAKEMKELLAKSPVVYATLEQEKEFSAGNFNDAVAPKRAGVFLQPLEVAQALNVELSAPAVYAMQAIKAGTLKGVELELGVRILRFQFDTVQAGGPVLGKAPAPAPPPGKVSEDEDKNKVYVNEGAAFAIVFPPDWTVRQDVTGVLVRGTSAKEENDDFVEYVDVETAEQPETAKLDDVYTERLKSLQAQPGFKAVTEDDATLGGAKARKLVWTKPDQGLNLKIGVYVMLAGKRSYIITYFSTAESFERFKESFDWVLENVKLGGK